MSLEQLRAIREQIESLPSVVEKVAVRSAAELTTLARASFDARQSVYGDPFPPGVDLYESGKLRELAVQYAPLGTRIRASVASVRYAKYKIKHGILPRGGQALPASFDAAIGEAATDELAIAMAKVGVT